MGRLWPDIAALRTEAAFAERIAVTGGQVLMTGPDALEQRPRRELPLWRQVVAEAGIRPE